VVKSEFMRDELATLYKINTEKVHVIPNGVDYPRYANARASVETLNQLRKNKPGQTVLIYCGRLVRMKNVDFLLQAFSKMTSKNNCVLVILGEGEERKNLEQKASALGVAHSVRFIGKTNHVEEFFAAADIFVFPSTYEPFGNALIEAMVAGLACVVLKPDGERIRTASAEIINDGYSGYLVDQDIMGLASRLDKLVLDRSLREAVGSQAQRIARERYDWSKCAAEYVRLLTPNNIATHAVETEINSVPLASCVK
jgi:glycosyltransferase involved in cell wall biosynthesis